MQKAFVCLIDIYRFLCTERLLGNVIRLLSVTEEYFMKLSYLPKYYITQNLYAIINSHLLLLSSP